MSQKVIYHGRDMLEQGESFGNVQDNKFRGFNTEKKRRVHAG